MTTNSIATVRNGQMVDLANLPPVVFGEFRDMIVSAVKAARALTPCLALCFQKSASKAAVPCKSPAIFGCSRCWHWSRKEF